MEYEKQLEDGSYIDSITGLRCMDVERWIDKYGANMLTNDIISYYLHILGSKLLSLVHTIDGLEDQKNHPNLKYTEEEIITSKYKIFEIQMDIDLDKDESDNRTELWKYIDPSITMETIYKRIAGEYLSSKYSLKDILNYRYQ